MNFNSSFRKPFHEERGEFERSSSVISKCYNVVYQQKRDFLLSKRENRQAPKGLLMLSIQFDVTRGSRMRWVFFYLDNKFQSLLYIQPTVRWGNYCDSKSLFCCVLRWKMSGKWCLTFFRIPSTFPRIMTGCPIQFHFSGFKWFPNPSKTTLLTKRGDFLTFFHPLIFCVKSLFEVRKAAVLT